MIYNMNIIINCKVGKMKLVQWFHTSIYLALLKRYEWYKIYL